LSWRINCEGIAVEKKIYAIDHKGVFRYKWIGYPGAKAIDAGLEKLIKEAAGDGKDAPK